MVRPVASGRRARGEGARVGTTHEETAMWTRRDRLKLDFAAGATLALPLRSARAEGGPSLITRAIPSTGERLPVVGLGSSATFAKVARARIGTRCAPSSRPRGGGGTVFDTAPAYGASEEVAGGIAAELGITDKLFWATKVNVAGRAAGGRSAAAGPDRGLVRAPEDAGDRPRPSPQPRRRPDSARTPQRSSRRRAASVTSASPPPRRSSTRKLGRIMASEPVDFIGIDYAVDNRAVEGRILPLATERRIGVLAYLPFGRTRLWQARAGARAARLAAELDARSWAQFFLKFVVAHPAVTAATPATSRAEHMIDNLGAAVGRLPDEALRRRMIEHVASLPG